MTIIRTGDPEYLRLLAGITPPPYDTSWDLLDSAWDDVTTEARASSLYKLARVSLSLVAKLTHTDLEDVLVRARDMHVEKNAGYAGADQPDPWANFRMATLFGISPFDGVLVRMSDKYIRSMNLRRDPSNERLGESLADTLFDLGAYALIAICLLEEGATTA